MWLSCWIAWKYCYASEFASVAITVPPADVVVVEVVADVGTLVVSAVKAAVVADVAVASVTAASVGVHCGCFCCSVHSNAWRWPRPVQARPKPNVSRTCAMCVSCDELALAVGSSRRVAVKWFGLVGWDRR